MKNNLIFLLILLSNNPFFCKTGADEIFLYCNLNGHATDKELDAIKAYINIYSFIYKKSSYELSDSFLRKNHCFRISDQEQKNLIEFKLGIKVNDCLRSASIKNAKYVLNYHNICNDIYFIELELIIGANNDKPKAFFPDLHAKRLCLDINNRNFKNTWIGVGEAERHNKRRCLR